MTRMNNAFHSQLVFAVILSVIIRTPVKCDFCQVDSFVMELQVQHPAIEQY